MSSLVFPTLAGIDIAVKRTPVFSTLVQTSISGKETRASFQSTPRYRYELPLNFARQYGFSVNTTADEVALLSALFNSVQGKWDSFWLPDAMAVNLIPNGTSEEPNPSGVGAAGLSSFTSYGGASLGTKCRAFSGGASSLLVSAYQACVPGEQFLFNLKALCTVASDSTLFIYMSFINNVGTEILFTGINPALNNSAWVDVTTIQTAPAGAVAVCFAIFAGTGGVTYYLDNMMGLRMTMAGLSVVPDGVLTQIVASADGIYMQLQRKVRFDMDELEMERMLNLCWKASIIKMISLK
jgi:hypothetical protein